MSNSQLINKYVYVVAYFLHLHSRSSSLPFMLGVFNVFNTNITTSLTSCNEIMIFAF